MNSTLTIDTAHAGERSSAAYELCITGLNGVRASAIIWPTSLTPALVSGIVEWQDPMCMSSIVSTEGDPSAWLQRLFLVFAAAGPTSIRYVPELASEHWASFSTSFPDPDGDARDQIRIFLSRARWQAIFSSTNPKRLTVHLSIPTELRELDAGSLLLEMTSRLALYQSSSTK